MIFATPTLGKPELKALQRLEVLRRQLGYAIQTPQRWTGLLRRNLIARAIQGSNSIEGYNVSFEEAVVIVEGEAPDAAEDTRLALEGYRRALTYVVQLSDDRHIVINEELIRSLHYMMIAHDASKHPGRWRPGAIFVRRHPSGERVYEGPDAEQVPELMREFVRDLQIQDEETPVIVRAAMAHLNLVMIHPFSDGNGRMGRAVQTLVLSRDGILASPFSSIEEYLGSRGNTERYYSVLASVGGGSWRPERDAIDWIRFCIAAHVQQALTVGRRIREIQRLWDEMENELRRNRLDNRMIFALYEAAIGFKVRSGRYQTVAEVSNAVASRDLRALVKAGFLVPSGEKRGRFYMASPALIDLRDRTREARVSAEEFLGQPRTSS